MFFLLLTTQFYLMSDRTSFLDNEKISVQTEFYKNSDTEKTTFPFMNKEIEGKNILVLVHGYNNNAYQALSTYKLINDHVSQFNDTSGFYDLVIGYIWPGDDSSLEYYDAKSRVPKISEKLRIHLQWLSTIAAKVDLLAHSMGNLVVLEAINFQSMTEKKILQNFYAIAPAVDNESIEKNEKYYFSTQNCANVFVFFSKRDVVLKWLYRVAELDLALGYKGVENLTNLPSNVQLINYTNSITGHSQYFTHPPLYSFIKQKFLLKPNS